MVIKYTNIYHSKALPNLPKFGIFGLKANHLATLVGTYIPPFVEMERKIVVQTQWENVGRFGAMRWQWAWAGKIVIRSAVIVLTGCNIFAKVGTSKPVK
jgi:hypothetical protein